MDINILMTFLSSIGAIISAYFAFVADRISKSNLAYQFFVRYSDDKMRQSLRVMGEFKRRRDIEDKYKNEFIDVWHEALIHKKDWALELEEARHVIKFFYRDVAILYQAGAMRYSTVEKICTAGGIFLFTDCIMPLEQKANPFPYSGEYDPIPSIAEKMRRQREQFRAKA